MTETNMVTVDWHLLDSCLEVSNNLLELSQNLRSEHLGDMGHSASPKDRVYLNYLLSLIEKSQKNISKLKTKI